jgi:hypothetical protein
MKRSTALTADVPTKPMTKLTHTPRIKMTTLITKKYQ